MRRDRKSSSAAEVPAKPAYLIVSDNNAAHDQGERRIVIKVDRRPIDDAVNRVLAQRRHRRVRGQRVDRIDSASIRTRVRRAMFADAASALFMDLGIDPAEDPQIECIGQGAGVSSRGAWKPLHTLKPTLLVAVTFHVTPDFRPDPSVVSVTRPAVVVTAERLAAALERLRQEASTYHTYGGPAAAGHFVRIQIEGEDGQRMYHLGDPSNDALADSLIGVRMADHIDVDGRTVAVLDVMRQHVPPLDRDLATRTIHRASVKALVDNIRAKTRAELNDMANEAVDKQAVEALLAQIPFSIPGPMVDRELRRRQQNPEGIDQDAPEWKAAHLAVGVNLVLEAVARAHDITVTDGDVYTHLKASVGEMPIDEALAQAGGLAPVRAMLRRRAATAIIRRRITVQQAPAPEIEAPEWPEDGQTPDTNDEPVTATEENPHEARDDSGRPGGAA